MFKPEVSVVMSVYNGDKYLRESVESILSQEGVDFEFIIVNDGSTDDSGNILAEYATRDNRISIIEQENTGLTRALIRGCEEAKGKFIARQDSGDISHPERLKKQIDYLESHGGVSLASCWTIFTGPEGEEIIRDTRYESPEEATKKLRLLDVRKIKGITHHGTAMFRQQDYLRAGGYRKQFYFAQDLDLWLRLTDFGLVGFVPKFLYQARYSASGISSISNKMQIELAKIIIRLSKIRQQNGNESELLDKAAKIKPIFNKYPSRENDRGFYFIGKCLLDRGDRRAFKYLIRAIRSNPFSLKSWYAIFAGLYRKV